MFGAANCAAPRELAYRLQAFGDRGIYVIGHSLGFFVNLVIHIELVDDRAGSID
jgi:hypothetical protein